MKTVKAFLAFWYDFIVGDDWRMALGVVVGLTLTWVAARAGWDAWLVLPAAVAIVLGLSLRRASVRNR